MLLLLLSKSDKAVSASLLPFTFLLSPLWEGQSPRLKATTLVCVQWRAGRARFASMKDYRRGAHTVFEIHLHIVWTTKYRKPVMTGEVGIRVRELIREICG